MKEYLLRKEVAVKVRTEKVMSDVIRVLTDKKGSFLEEVIKYIIYFVIGALLLAGLYALFKNVILPALQTKTENMFNYTA